MSKHTMHLIIFEYYVHDLFSLAYHYKALDGEKVHGTCKGEEVCDIQIVV